MEARRPEHARRSGLFARRAHPRAARRPAPEAVPPPRAVVASPEEELRSFLATLLQEEGFAVSPCAQAAEAFLAALEEGVTMAILDEDLSPVSGSTVAQVVEGVRRPVTPVVIHRGEVPDDRGILALDRTRPGFDRALRRVIAAARAVPGWAG